MPHGTPAHELPLATGSKTKTMMQSKTKKKNNTDKKHVADSDKAKSAKRKAQPRPSHRVPAKQEGRMRTTTRPSSCDVL